MVEIIGDHSTSHSQAPLIIDLIGALPDPILVINSATGIVAANAPARDVFSGIGVGNALAFAVRSPQVLDAVSLVLAGAERQTVSWRERTPIERLFDVAISPFALDGKVAVVLEFRDVTEAHSVERMRVNFIANVSHELRTPLTTLLGFIETLQGPARDDAKAREKFLGIMGEQARRMTRLVDDLLSLSRIELNEHVRPQTSVDLVSIVRRIVDALEPVARDAGVTLNIVAPPRVEMDGDVDDLARLVENLVENAIKYGAYGQTSLRVDVTVTQSEANAELIVRDNGPGIASEDLPRLTERFYRVDAPASRARGGTGLGLAIVKHIVLRHRGRLAIESQLNVGSAFRVIFPN